jgi:putative transcriptional regulator
MIRFLCALFLLVGFSAPARADADPMGAIFLVARGGLGDPNFRNSVVLLTHEVSEPTGVIINVPTDTPLSSVFPDIEIVDRGADKVFFGGPVRPSLLTFVFRAPTRPDNAIEILDGVYLSSSRALLRKLLQSGEHTDLRVYSGYASWGTEQLEEEIGRGDWHWERADAKAIFEKRPQVIWWELNRHAPRGMSQGEAAFAFAAARAGSQAPDLRRGARSATFAAEDSCRRP